MKLVKMRTRPCEGTPKAWQFTYEHRENPEGSIGNYYDLKITIFTRSLRVRGQITYPDGKNEEIQVRISSLDGSVEQTAEYLSGKLLEFALEKAADDNLWFDAILFPDFRERDIVYDISQESTLDFVKGLISRACRDASAEGITLSEWGDKNPDDCELIHLEMEELGFTWKGHIWERANGSTMVWSKNPILIPHFL